MQLSALLRLLAEAKRYEDSHQKYLEKAAREFFRHMFNFGSNQLHLPSIEAGTDIHQDIERAVQSVRVRIK